MLRPMMPAVFHRASQSWFYTSHVLAVTTAVSLRVTLRRNAYDEQSFGRVEAFDRAHNCWNEVVSLPVAELACAAVSAMGSVLTEAERGFFLRDAERLLARAALILQEPDSHLRMAA